MTSLSIRHETRYSYERPVSFGPHRLLVRPRDSHALRLTDASLTLSPPGETRWAYDALGNSVCIFTPQGEALDPAELRNMAVLGGASAAFVLPVTFLLIGLENLLFLLFPSRMMANQAGDFQAVGRNVLLVFAKLSGLALALGLAVLVGVVLWVLFGRREIFIPDLGRDMQILARDLRGRNRRTDRFFVAVHLRGVDVAIAER